MNIKKCTKCSINKPVAAFNKASAAAGSTDGYMARCKACTRIQVKAYTRTKKGLAVTMRAAQGGNAKQRNHVGPDYNSNTLYEWLMAQKLFHTLYDTWVQSGHDKYLRPSCDRINDSKPYTLNNLRIVTWKDNLLKENLVHKSVRVLQYDPEHNLIAEYTSANEAARAMNVSSGSICSAIHREHKSKGFIWKHA